jgi:hypothetical protein
MMLKMFGGLALALGLGLAGTTSAVPTAPATDCCAAGLSCCPDGPCCIGAKTLAADCCAAGLPCCEPPSACCFGVEADCCAAGAACCPDGSCCLAAKAKTHGCCAAPSRAACCCAK